MKPEYLIHAEHLTVILCPLEKQHKILEHLKKRFLLQNWIILRSSKNWPMFPYLNLKDHVLLDVPEKKSNKIVWPIKKNLISLLPCLIVRQLS